MEPHEKIERSLLLNRWISMVLGLDIWNENFHLNFLSYLVIFDAVTYILMTLHNVYEFWGDLNRLCYCLVTWAFGFMGIARIVVLLSCRKKFIELNNIVVSETKKHEKDPQTAEFAKRYSGYTYLFTRFLPISYSINGILALLMPCYSIFIKHELLLPYGFVIPGVSDQTHPGFEINYFHHFLQTIIVVPGFALTTNFTIIYCLNICLQIDAMSVKLKKLIRQLEAPEKIGNLKLQDADLSEIVQMHQQVSKFVSCLEDMYCIQYAIDALFIEFQVILCLYVLLVNFWLFGAVLICNTLGILLIDCIYGYVIEIKFDSICTQIYEVPWHLLKPTHRRTLNYMLARSQVPELPTFGKIAPLNMATFVQILKSIYSFVMFLQNTNT